MAIMAELVNVIAPIFSNDQGVFLQTIFYPLALFANNSKGKSLELFMDGARYKSRRFDDIPYLDASAAYDNGALVLNVVNRHKDQDIEADFDLQDKQYSGAVERSEFNAPDITPETDVG